MSEAEPHGPWDENVGETIRLPITLGIATEHQEHHVGMTATDLLDERLPFRPGRIAMQGSGRQAPRTLSHVERHHEAALAMRTAEVVGPLAVAARRREPRQGAMPIVEPVDAPMGDEVEPAAEVAPERRPHGPPAHHVAQEEQIERGRVPDELQRSQPGAAEERREEAVDDRDVVVLVDERLISAGRARRIDHQVLVDGLDAGVRGADVDVHRPRQRVAERIRGV